eukprot:scaffold10833_cov114-Skeletonema_marinoi.AAC.5
MICQQMQVRAAGRICMRAKEEKIGLTHIFPSHAKTHTFALCSTQYYSPLYDYLTRSFKH